MTKYDSKTLRVREKVNFFFERIGDGCFFDKLQIYCFGKDKFEFVIDEEGLHRDGMLYCLEMSPAINHMGHLAFHGDRTYYHEYGHLYTAEEIFNDAIYKLECPVSLFIDELYDREGQVCEVY